jgi:hypothetical protein
MILGNKTMIKGTKLWLWEEIYGKTKIKKNLMKQISRCKIKLHCKRQVIANATISYKDYKSSNDRFEI